VEAPSPVASRRSSSRDLGASLLPWGSIRPRHQNGKAPRACELMPPGHAPQPILGEPPPRPISTDRRGVGNGPGCALPPRRRPPRESGTERYLSDRTSRARSRLRWSLRSKIESATHTEKTAMMPMPRKARSIGQMWRKVCTAQACVPGAGLSIQADGRAIPRHSRQVSVGGSGRCARATPEHRP